MRESKGKTHVKAHCKVCGHISPATVYTENGVLTLIHIQCYEHADYLLNKIKFGPMRKGQQELKVEHHGY